MSLTRQQRVWLSIPLTVLGIPGMVLWGVGTGIKALGIAIWMFCHRVCREPGCACEECVQFDGAAPKFAPPDEEPPAAA